MDNERIKARVYSRFRQLKDVFIDSPADEEILVWDEALDKYTHKTASELGITTVGNSVTASATLDDNALVRGDGGTRGAQTSGVSLDDADAITGLTEISANGIKLYYTAAHSGATGMVNGGGELSINADTTKFDISAGSGYIHDTFTDPDNPTMTEVTWTTQTAVASTYVATDNLSWVKIDSSGTVVQQNTEPSREDHRDFLIVGVLVHPGPSISAVADQSHSIDTYLTEDLANALGNINLSGNDFNPASTDLTLRRESGVSFAPNGNRSVDPKNPNYATSSLADPLTFIYIYNDGSNGITAVPGQTDIDPNQYDDGSGTLAAVGNSKWTNQYCYFNPSTGIAFIRYGTEVFNTQTAAESAQENIPVAIGTGATSDFIRTVISVKKDETNLTSSSTSYFNTGRFGLGAGGGSTGSGLPPTVAADSVRVDAIVNEAGGITAGQVVTISGATSGFPQVSLADNTNFSLSDVLAVATETAADSASIIVTVLGVVNNIDTSAFTEGDVLYLSTSGSMTATHPTGLDAVQRIGHAVNIDASTGSILVELDHLTVINDHNGTVRHQLVNQSSGGSAGAAYTLVNDAGRYGSLSITSSAFSVPFPEGDGTHNITLYNQGYGDTFFTIDGNKAFYWLTDTTDSHNLSATVKMALTAAGELETQQQLMTHVAAEPDDHALEIDVDAAGLGDVKAIDIAYDTGAITTGDIEAVILLNIDETQATGGNIFGLEVLATEGAADGVAAVFSGAGIRPVEQLSGAFANADTVLVKAVDQTTALSTGGAGNISVFVADNDTVTIGSASIFEEIEILVDTAASGSGIAPNFEYSTGVGTWASFTPTDGTNGLRNSGVIAWLDEDTPGFAIGTGSEYLVRITRTRNSLSTTPIIDKVQVVEAAEYKWDENGNITAASFSGDGSSLTGVIPGEGVNTGTNVSATGLVASIAQGSNATATGNNGSFAQGNQSTVTGDYGSFAQGKNVEARGNSGSFSQGYDATAIANQGSFAQGLNSTATGSNGSFAQGFNITSTGGYGSFAQGGSFVSDVVATGKYGSFAQGGGVFAGVSATGSYGSFAQGFNATATGNFGSFAQGASATATGSNGSFAQGRAATATGSNGCFAMGSATTANSAGSFAFGAGAKANAAGAAQFGAGTNSQANTLRVGAGPRLGNTALTQDALVTTDANGILTDSSLLLASVSIRPQQMISDATNGFGITVRNQHVLAAFDDTTDETGYYTGHLPENYDGNGLTVDIIWVAATATTGNVVWNVAFEALNAQDIDSDGFAAVNASSSDTTNGTSGIPTTSTITFTDGGDMDSIAAGQLYRVKITRDADNAGGGSLMTGDAQILEVVIR